MTQLVYEIDGRKVHSLEDFTSLAGEAVGGPGTYFGSSNLDAFADCLSGGFGTPDDGDFAFRLRYAEAARAALGHESTLAWLRWNLPAVLATNLQSWEKRMIDAAAAVGETLFDEVVAIFRERGVPLILE